MTNQAYSISVQSAVVATAVTDSTPIEYGNFQSGMVYVPTGSTITTLTWYASHLKEGPYFPVDDASGAALVQSVAAEQAHPIPVALQGAMFLKITGDVAGEVSYTLKD